MHLFDTTSPCLAAAPRPARSGGLVRGPRGALLGFVLVEHRAGGGAALLTELVAVLGAPVVRLRTRPVVAAEMRHYIAGIKLIGALGFLPIGPVVGLLQEDAKCALLLVQPLDQGDGIIRCADHAVLVLDKPFERVLAGRHHETALVVVQVIKVSLESETG